MIIGPQIFARLSGNQAIANIIGSGANARIYPMVAGADQPSVFPYITYQVKRGTIPTGLRGAMGIAFPVVQFNVWMNNFDYDLLEQLAELVKQCLQNWRDLTNGIQGSGCVGFGDLPPDEESKAVGRYWDFQLHVSEAVSDLE